MNKTDKKTVTVYREDELGQWVSLQDASRVVMISDKTLYAAVYRDGKGRRPTIPSFYQEGGKRKRILCVPIRGAIEYKAQEIEQDAQRTEFEIRALLQQHGVTEEEFQAIVGSYKRAFERVVGEVRAREMEGVAINESAVA